jgi:hypothetical protein
MGDMMPIKHRIIQLEGVLGTTYGKQLVGRHHLRNRPCTYPNWIQSASIFTIDDPFGEI